VSEETWKVVLACPVRMLKIAIMETENQGETGYLGE